MTGPDRPQEPRWSEEDLLELLLEGRDEQLREARGDPATAARLEGLERFLARWRGPLANAPSTLSASSQWRLTQAVLARTTRQDTSWRGDVAVVVRFLRDRLAASPMLRVAAAILLLQVLALPVLAWIAWRRPADQRVLTFHVRPERMEKIEPFLPAVPEAPLDELFAQPGDVELQPAHIAPRPGPLEVQHALAAGARALESSSWPRPDPEGGGRPAWQDDPALRFLADRARLARDPALTPAELGADAPPATGVGGGLERALRAELLLDELTLTGEAPAELAAAIGALGSDAREPAAVRHLEALAVERARTLGHVDARAWSRLAGQGAVPGSRSADPLDEGWRAALREALESDPRTRPMLRYGDLERWLGAAR